MIFPFFLTINRLEELQQAMVGGEQANNEEVKERIRNKKKYAEERKRKLKGNSLLLFWTKLGNLARCEILDSCLKIRFMTVLFCYFLCILPIFEFTQIEVSSNALGLKITSFQKW